VKTKLLATAVQIASKYPGMEVRYMNTDVLRQGGVAIYKGVYQRETQYVQLAVRGNADQDVDLAVFDEGKNEVCKDVDVDAQAGDISVCAHTPRWTGNFIVAVKMSQGSGWYGYMVMHKQ
jgi:hypothetical protein